MSIIVFCFVFETVKNSSEFKKCQKTLEIKKVFKKNKKT